MSLSMPEDVSAEHIYNSLVEMSYLVDTERGDFIQGSQDLKRMLILGDSELKQDVNSNYNETNYGQGVASGYDSFTAASKDFYEFG